MTPRWFSPVLDETFRRRPPPPPGVGYFWGLEKDTAFSPPRAKRLAAYLVNGTHLFDVAITPGAFAASDLGLNHWSAAESAGADFIWLGTSITSPNGYRLLKIDAKTGVLLNKLDFTGATKLPVGFASGSGQYEGWLAIGEDGRIWVGTYTSVSEIYLQEHTASGAFVAERQVPVTYTPLVQQPVPGECAVVAGRKRIMVIYEEDNNPPGPTSFEWRVAIHRWDLTTAAWLAVMRSDPVGPDQASDPLKFSTNIPAGPDRVDAAMEAYLPIGNAGAVDMVVWAVNDAGAFSPVGTAADPNDWGSDNKIVYAKKRQVFRTASDNIAPYSGDDDLRAFDTPPANSWGPNVADIGEGGVLISKWFPAHFLSSDKDIVS